jgi:hypothetical protein
MPKAPVGASRNVLEAWLQGQTQANPALQDEVLRNTHTTLAQLVGRPVPPGLKVNAIQEVPTDLYLVRRFDGAMEPVDADGTGAQVLRTSVHLMAMEDERLWDQLAANPRPILAERLGLNLPSSVNVHVLTEDAQNAYLVLHHPPHLAAWRPPATMLAKLGLAR